MNSSTNFTKPLVLALALAGIAAALASVASPWSLGWAAYVAGLGCVFADLGGRRRLAALGDLSLGNLGLGILAALGLAVLAWPQLDGQMSLQFLYQGKWIGRQFANLVAHNVLDVVGGAILIGGGLGLVAMLFRVGGLLQLWARAAAFLLVAQLTVVYALGSGVLKPLIARVRPQDSIEQMQAGQFEPWFWFARGCTSNCSMPSGEATLAFGMFALALALSGGRLRPALVLGSLVGCLWGLVRVSAGKHYPSDVAVAAIVAMGGSWLLYRLLSWAGRRLAKR